MHTVRRQAVPAAVLLLVLTGCGSDGEGAAAATEPAPLPAEFDPPLEFGEPIPLGDGYQVDTFHIDADPDGGTVYTYQQATAAIKVWRLSTGAEQQTATIELDGGRPRVSPDGSPYAFVDTGDQVVLVVAYQHREAGVGTRPDAEVLRVRAYHAGDGALAWSTDLDDSGVDDARILVANADHTVIVTGARDPASERVGMDEASVAGVSTVLDTATGQVRRAWDPFVAYALDRDVVAGLHPDPEEVDNPDQPAHALQGRHVVTGETVWEYPDTLVSGSDYFGRDLGGGAFLQPARSRGTASVVSATLSTNLVLEVATGDLLLEIDHDGGAVTCRYDGDQLMACGHDQDDRAEPFLAAYDLHGRTLLWDLDDISAGRDLPDTVTAVHRGAIYMDFSSSRSRPPVALDGRTGTDLAVDLPLAPARVGPGFGVTHDELGHLSIYLATG